MKKNKEPAFLFYPADWLKDPELKMCSFKAKGVWIDLISISFEFKEKGVFRKDIYSNNGGNGQLDSVEIPRKDESEVAQRSLSRPLNVDEIVNLLSGNRREARRGFCELVEKGVIKQMDDSTFYCKRLHDDQKLRQIRRAAGKLGGNPALLKDKVNQKEIDLLNQKSGNGLRLTSVTHSVTKDSVYPPDGGHDPLDRIILKCETIRELSEKSVRKKMKINIYAWVQIALNERGHPEAIIACLDRLIIKWDDVGSAWPWLNATFKIKNGNFWEDEHVRESQKFKDLWIEDEIIQELVGKIGNLNEGGT
jgi:hypothetical protein